MGKRQETAVLTRKKLLDAAKELSNERSLSCVMVEDITGRARVAKGTFYTYFKHREDIFSEIASERFVHIREEFQSGPVEQRLGGYLRRSMELIVRDELELAQQWMKGAVVPADNDTAAMRKLCFDQGFIADTLTQAVASGELAPSAPADQLAWEITAEYYGLLALWCLTNGSLDVLERMREYTEKHLQNILNLYKKRKDD